MKSEHMRLQLRRSALLVHGLAWIAAGIAASIFFALQENPKVLGVPLVAAFVFHGWSMLLALRALRTGESAFWPVCVVVFGMIELAVVFAMIGMQWELDFEPAKWAYQLELPVIVPVMTFAILLAAPVALWRIRRAEHAAKSSGAGSWDHRRRWIYGMWWFAPIALIVFALLAPPLLFASALLNFKYIEYSRTPQSLDSWIVRNTPLAIAESTAAILATSSRPRCIEIYALALSSGCVARERLEAEMASTTLWKQVHALQGLEKTDPSAAVAVAEQISQRSMAGYGIEVLAASILSRLGSEEHIRRHLKAIERETSRASSSFNAALLDSLFRLAKRFEFVPDCICIAKSNSAYSQDARDVLEEHQGLAVRP